VLFIRVPLGLDHGSDANILLKKLNSRGFFCLACGLTHDFFTIL